MVVRMAESLADWLAAATVVLLAAQMAVMKDVYSVGLMDVPMAVL